METNYELFIGCALFVSTSLFVRIVVHIMDVFPKKIDKVINNIDNKQVKKIDNQHCNPSVQSVHRIPMRTSNMAQFLSKSEARASCGEFKSKNVVSLNGVWKFKLYRNIVDCIKSINSMDQQLLHDILVPGSWQLQVPGNIPIYTNFKYIIPVDPPNVPNENPTGYYKKLFSVSKIWENERIYLNFQGVNNAMYVWVNNIFIGFSKDSRLPAEFEIQDAVNFGETNVLEVIVVRFSDGFYLEDQDMFNLSGIFREVKMSCVPKDLSIFDYHWQSFIHQTLDYAIIDIHIKWRFDNDFSTSGKKYQWEISLYYEGILEASVEVTNDLVSSKAESQQFKFSNRSSSVPTVVQESTIEPSDVEQYQKDEHYGSSVMSLIIPKPSTHLWSAESPHVYTMIIALSEIITSDDSKELSTVQVKQCESCRVALRTISIQQLNTQLLTNVQNKIDSALGQKDQGIVPIASSLHGSMHGVLTINNRAVCIRGVNLHEHDPIYGHTISRELIEADIILIKRNNFNAIRTSHYPNNSWFYELCTLYGIYVIDEANIETHGMKPYIGRLADDKDWQDAFLLRLQRMYERDKNHPCIIGWSLGNESGYGATHQLMAAWIRQIESHVWVPRQNAEFLVKSIRFVSYEPASYGSPAVQERILKLMQNVKSFADESDFNKQKIGQDINSCATDILCPMYARINECLTLSKQFPEYPLIQCEYSHMMGNSGGNLEDYWKVIRSKTYPFISFQGGFIWDWVDQGLAGSNSRNKSCWLYGGDFGEVEHDGNFCLNGLNWPDRGIPQRVNGNIAPPYILLNETALHDDMQGRDSRDMVNCITASSPLGPARHKPVINFSPYGCSAPEHDAKGSASQNSSTFFDLDQSISKPCLIEAKQCMVCFRSHVLSCDLIHGGIKSSDNAVTGDWLSDVIFEFELEIENLFDHVDIISDVFQFESYLLCDGIIVSVSSISLLPTSSALQSETIDLLDPVYLHIHYPYTRHSASTHHKCNFKLDSLSPPKNMERYAGMQPVFTSTTKPSTVELQGIPINQSMLHSLNELKKVKQLLYELSNQSICENDQHDVWWTDVDLLQNANAWSLLVVSRLKSSTSWASKDFPMGFSQIEVDKKEFQQCLNDIDGWHVAEVVGKVEEKSSIKFEEIRIKWKDHLVDGKMKNWLTWTVGQSEVTICTESGIVESWIRDGQHILFHRTPGESKCRIHLHRAATDNDRYGYSFLWHEVGIDKAMKYAKNPRYPSSLLDNNVSDETMNQYEFEYVTIQINKDSNSHQILSIKCLWALQYDQVDRAKLMLIELIQQFLSNPSQFSLELNYASRSELDFALQLVGASRLGRQVIPTESNDEKGIVKVWKPELFMCSTIKIAEGFCVVPDIQSNSEMKEDGKEDWISVQVLIEVLYELDSLGQLRMGVEVDPSELKINCLPRIGLQINIDPSYQNVSWHGDGPHECYPDRKGSAIHGLHDGPNNIDALYVPYIRPSENGNRSHVQWLQLSSTMHQSSCIRMVCNSWKDDLVTTSNFNFSVLPFSTEDHVESNNSVELEQYPRSARYRCLNIDPYLQGVGGDDSWTSMIHKEYLLPSACIRKFEVLFNVIS